VQENAVYYSRLGGIFEQRAIYGTFDGVRRFVDALHVACYFKKIENFEVFKNTTR
jgi:hypothetical protein